MPSTETPRITYLTPVQEQILAELAELAGEADTHTSTPVMVSRRTKAPAAVAKVPANQTVRATATAKVGAASNSPSRLQALASAAKVSTDAADVYARRAAAHGNTPAQAAASTSIAAMAPAIYARRAARTAAEPDALLD
ncbi:MAG TPA: hypothetical protein VFI49_08135 [Rudaea sp.]|nr:hypothetical protein [Rudaea sp.]